MGIGSLYINVLLINLQSGAGPVKELTQKSNAQSFAWPPDVSLGEQYH